MKKALIAGAASAVLAAMPVVGVFAADNLGHTDTINVTISPVCTLGTVNAGVAQDDDATTHNPTEANASFAGIWAANDTLNATMAAGTKKDLGTTTFTVRCNNQKGFTLSAKTGTDTGTLVNGSGNTIATAKGDKFAAGTAGTSYWNFKAASSDEGITIATGYSTDAAIPTTSTTIATAAENTANVNEGQKITVTYGAGIDNFQQTGTYTGTVVYTLAAVTGTGTGN